MNSFFLKLVSFSIAIVAIDYCWNNFMESAYSIPHWDLIVAFFIVTTLGFHLFSIKAAKGKPQNFIRFYMGSTALKMGLCLMVILIYRFADKATVIPFAIGFMFHYFLFTAFEVILLLKHLKK